MISHYQFDFRSKVSTTNALVYCTKSFRIEIDKSKYVALARLGLSFSLGNHSALSNTTFWRRNYLIKDLMNHQEKCGSILLATESKKSASTTPHVKRLNYIKVCYKAQTYGHFSLTFLSMT